MKITEGHDFKVNDVYEFRYNEEMAKKLAYPYHCFDGTLIVRKSEGGSIYLVDTYWSSDNRMFTIKEALNQGNLTFICNLDEVDELKDFCTEYYDDSDIIRLKIHAGYRNETYLRKGAVKSKDKMISVIKEKIEMEESNIRSAKGSIAYLNETLKKVESGDLNVYF